MWAICHASGIRSASTAHPNIKHDPHSHGNIGGEASKAEEGKGQGHGNLGAISLFHLNRPLQASF